MKIKVLIALLLMSSVVSGTTLVNDNFVNVSSEKTEYTEINPLIFDFWW